MEESVTFGRLHVEKDFDPDRGEIVTVTKIDDLEGWITFTRCPVDSQEWTAQRNRCYPLNGRDVDQPIGKWVVHEYVGRDSSSLNLEFDRSKHGFTDDEIRAVSVVVNLAFGSEHFSAMVAGSVKSSDKKH